MHRESLPAVRSFHQRIIQDWNGEIVARLAGKKHKRLGARKVIGSRPGRTPIRRHHDRRRPGTARVTADRNYQAPCRFRDRVTGGQKLKPARRIGIVIKQPRHVGPSLPVHAREISTDEDLRVPLNGDRGDLADVAGVEVAIQSSVQAKPRNARAQQPRRPLEITAHEDLPIRLPGQRHHITLDGLRRKRAIHRSIGI